ncbi:hypothetical protein ACFOGI_06570 [Virgibacillus xinjiangensis]|uniref:Holin n=1 Tax=Virgibacillus xinjiangensis TaxID=393090 RepID=A0ABV7CU99_9BACI
MLQKMMDRIALLPEWAKEAYILLAITLIGILVVYKVAEPIVHWMVFKKMIHLLSYAVSSFGILASLLLLTVWSGDEHYAYLLKVVLQGFAAFGGGLIITTIYRRFTKRIR